MLKKCALTVIPYCAARNRAVCPLKSDKVGSAPACNNRRLHSIRTRSFSSPIALTSNSEVSVGLRLENHQHMLFIKVLIGPVPTYESKAIPPYIINIRAVLNKELAHFGLIHRVLVVIR